MMPCEISRFQLIDHIRVITKTCLLKYIESFTTKNGNFPMKNCYIVHVSAQNIDCGYPLEPPRRGGSNEYPQSMFLSRNEKNNVYPCKPQFYYIKMGFKGSKLYMRGFVMSHHNFCVPFLQYLYDFVCCELSPCYLHIPFRLMWPFVSWLRGLVLHSTDINPYVQT